MLNFFVGLISGIYLGFIIARRWPRLLAPTRPLAAVPLMRYEFRPPVALVAAHHREFWVSRTLKFVRACDRVSAARSVAEGRVPSLETLRLGIGMSKRAAQKYLDVLERGGMVEIVPYAGAYWREPFTRRSGRRIIGAALTGLPYPAGARPPRF